MGITKRRISGPQESWKQPDGSQEKGLMSGEHRGFLTPGRAEGVPG